MEAINDGSVSVKSKEKLAGNTVVQALRTTWSTKTITASFASDRLPWHDSSICGVAKDRELPETLEGALDHVQRV